MIKKILTVFFFLSIFSHLSAQANQLSKESIYLVIVSDDYADSPSLQTFISFRAKEFTVQVETGTNIGNTKDDYRNYIRKLMPAYVLLVGKYGDFPVHLLPYQAEVESYNYYVASSISGHPKPDIPLGLFFAENETELANLVNKTISYENNSNSYPNIYYAHAGSNEPLSPWPVEFNEEILTEMYDRYFEPNGYAFTLATANDNTPNDVWTDINMINGGIRYMIYHGHGAITKWTFGLGVGGLPQLTNTVYPIIFSFSCLTGSFSGVIDNHSGACFAQKITASEHGAVAYVGAYNIAGRAMNQLLEGSVNGIFNDSVPPRLGNILLYAYANNVNTNTVNKYYPTVTEIERSRTAWQFHLFGDPALKIRDVSAAIHDEFIDQDIVKIYPNPSSAVYRIVSNFDVKEIIIYSLCGEILLREKNVSEVDFTDFPSGTYFLSVKSDNALIYKKVIKID